MTKKEILHKLTNLKKEVRLRYKAELKGIFGSFARDEQRINSDIDILVTFFKEADLFDFVGLGQFLEEQLNCRVDVVPEQDIRLELKDTILKEAIYI